MRAEALKRGGATRAVLAWSTLALGFGVGNVGLAGGHGPVESVDVDLSVASNAKIRGIELGVYRIRAHYPVEAQKSVVRFVLHAAVATEHFAEAERIVEVRRHKLRDEVITATRMTPLTVFDESGLTSFRRRILVRLRRALPELLIDDVYVSDFQLAVKSL
jgi:hypothetical protein